MTESTAEIGLVSKREAAVLREINDVNDSDRTAVISAIQGRVQKIFEDVGTLYMYLHEQEIGDIISGPGRQQERNRGSAQHLLALLYLGLTATGDDVVYRFEDAISEAEAALEYDTAVDIQLTRQRFLPAEEFLEALRADIQNVSCAGFERAFYRDDIPADELAAALSEVGFEDITSQDIRSERQGTQGIYRMPKSTIIKVENDQPPE